MTPWSLETPTWFRLMKDQKRRVTLRSKQTEDSSILKWREEWGLPTGETSRLGRYSTVTLSKPILWGRVPNFVCGSCFLRMQHSSPPSSHTGGFLEYNESEPDWLAESTLILYFYGKGPRKEGGFKSCWARIPKKFFRALPDVDRLFIEARLSPRLSPGAFRLTHQHQLQLWISL